jgi:UDP:flavonoid glycosyltransferase YjiC (YdhE family)
MGIGRHARASLPFMRIMFCTRAGAGHFGPLVPFARAFLRNNDEVVFVAPAESAAMIAGAGFDHELIPDPPPDGRAELFARARRMAWDDANELVVRELFVRRDTPATFPHVLHAIEKRRPDVVIWEESDFAAALAVEVTGVRSVSVGIVQARHLVLLGDAIAEALAEVRTQIGLPPVPAIESSMHFTLMPREFEDPEAPGPQHTLRFRERPAAARPLPDWWENTAWPLIYLTLGSVAPTMDFFPGVYREALDSLSHLPVRVLVTVGRDRDPADLGPMPPNVHVARWVPQADVMPHTAAMVCHGGSGTTRAGLAAGVPMAVLPLFADQPHNARRVTALGAGVTLDRASRAGDAVRWLLADPAYRDAAQRIATAIGKLPPVDTAVGIVQDMVAGREAAFALPSAVRRENAAA